MFVADRYDEYLDNTSSYAGNRSRRISYYDETSYDDQYESQRRSTTDADRERLMNSLERRSVRTRNERRDEDRYSFYLQGQQNAENNYDRLLRKRAEQGTSKEKKVFNKKKVPFVVAYVVFALAAVLAISLSLVGVKKTETPVDMSVNMTVEASAEEAALAASEVSAAEEEVVVTKEGGEMYVMLKSGELVAVEIPEITEVTKEEEKGFDKFCNWWNGLFGGNQ